MKLQEFAKSAGCVVKLMPKDEFDAGRWAYHAKDSPNIMFVGFRTEKAAYKAFIEDCFGTYRTPDAAKAVMRLLKKVDRLENLNRELRLNRNT